MGGISANSRMNIPDRASWKSRRRGKE